MEYSVSLMYAPLPDTSLTNYTGNLFGKEYGERVDDFKVEFERAQKSLDRSVGLEIFKSVDGIGRFHIKAFESS